MNWGNTRKQVKLRDKKYIKNIFTLL